MALLAQASVVQTALASGMHLLVHVVSGGSATAAEASIARDRDGFMVERGGPTS